MSAAITLTPRGASLALASGMNRSIADCRAVGIVFDAEEAVAIAQQLITSLREPWHADEIRAPYGPPSAQNVFLGSDGSVVCRNCTVTPAISEVGTFLEELLPGSARIPGGLRYTIARALRNVDVPPFDSLDELSQDLSRHERGNRADLVRRALERADGHLETSPVPLFERRRSRSSATTLRRELREADVRLYQACAGLNRQPVVIDLAAVAPAPQRRRLPAAAAACIAAGLALIAAGELIHDRPSPSVALPAPAPRVAHAAVPDPARADLPQPISVERGINASPERGIIAVRDIPSRAARSTRPDARRLEMKRATRRSEAAVGQRQTQRRPRGVLDRLRLGWIRRAFTTRSDL